MKADRKNPIRFALFHISHQLFGDLGDGDAVTGQIPEPGRTIPGNSEMLVYLGADPEERAVQVPDFTGMNRQQAADAGKIPET